MKTTAVILITNRQNEINRFLSTYFKTQMDIDMNTFKWTSLYEDPLHSIDLISVALDNIEEYDLEVLLQIDRSLIIKVSNDNINDIIKFLYNKRQS